MSELRVRDVSRADLDNVLTIRRRSFGPLGPDNAQWWDQVAAEVIPGRMLAVVDSYGRVLGAGRIRPYEQVWGGRHLRMGGVAGVYVEPSARGRGVATLLMQALITRMGQLGDVVSCLFPTAPALYRGVGYEVGGSHPRHTYAAHAVRAMRSLGGGLQPRPAGPDDAELVHELVRGHQARHRLSGPKLPSAATWREQLADPDLIHYVLDGRDGAARGFVAYGLSDATLTVEELVGETPEASAALWGVVGSGSSAAPKVASYLDPRDAGLLRVEEFFEAETRDLPWMFRVIDLVAAVAARGFSPHVTASVEIAVTDPEAPANDGTWRLTVGQGRGEASPAAYGKEPVQLGARGLAALWCGWTMSRLRLAGLATGGTEEADAALDAIFAGEPFMTEYF
jgi:predicted acetyltransferase